MKLDKTNGMVSFFLSKILLPCYSLKSVRTNSLLQVFGYNGRFVRQSIVMSQSEIDVQVGGLRYTCLVCEESCFWNLKIDPLVRQFQYLPLEQQN